MSPAVAHVAKANGSLRDENVVLDDTGSRDEADALEELAAAADAVGITFAGAIPSAAQRLLALTAAVEVWRRDLAAAPIRWRCMTWLR